MEQISVLDAAGRKGCSVQAIRDAIKRGGIDAVRIGKAYIVLVTDKFSEWHPSKRQNSGRARWSTKPKKSRRTA